MATKLIDKGMKKTILFSLALFWAIAAGAVTDLSKDGTANCYMVRSGSREYSFNASVKGNGVAPYGENASIDTREVKGVRLIWQDAGIIDAASVKYTSGRVTFRTVAKAREGNAVIALYSDRGCSDGKCLWSWHIWMTDASDCEMAGVRFLDRNLGAASPALREDGRNGLFYQWGRKDPFPAGPTLTGDTSTMPVDLYDMDGEVVKVSYSSWGSNSSNNLEYSIANPTVVLAGYSLPGSYQDWLKDENNSLWGNPDGNVRNDENEYPNKGSKSCYDPCPVGWRVPPVDVLRTATPSGGYDVDESQFDVDGEFNYGYYMNMAEGSSYFPASGRYYGAYGMLYGTVSGLWGNYWSNAPYASDGNQMGSIIVAFQKTATAASMSPLAGGAKSDAYPVRCIRDL